MTSADDILDGALRRLREASNPSAEERARILAAVRRPAAPGSTPRARQAAGLERRRTSPLARTPFVGGLLIGLAAFGAGIGVGSGLARSSLSTGAFEPGPTPTLPAPAEPLAEPPAEPPAASPAPRPEAPLARTSAPPQPAQAGQHPRSKPRARSSARRAKPTPSPLTLAEALQLLHRAERAIYSDNAVWAVSLLDQLDERAPPALLHEERVATRILAWCADGQVERAEQLAQRARLEAPSSIYGAILDQPCARSQTSSTSSAPSTRP